MLAVDTVWYTQARHSVLCTESPPLLYLVHYNGSQGAVIWVQACIIVQHKIGR
jgi:hypothetical protein